MSRLFNLTLQLKLIDSDMKSRVIGSLLHKPISYVEIVDIDTTVTELITCTDFAVTYDRDDLLGGFACKLVKAKDWNPRIIGYLDLLDIDKRKRINIYYGQYISGVEVYVKVFTGVMTEAPESYTFGSNDYIQIKGNNLGYLLQRLAGVYKNNNYSGTAKGLVEYWLDKAGIEHSLTFTDPIVMDAHPIAYSSALAGVVALKQIIGPSTEMYFDQDGKFIWQDAPDWSADDVEFEYTESNMTSLSKSADTSKIITNAEVTGNTETASSSKEASSSMTDKYGLNTSSVSSGLIITSSQADKLAQDILDNGATFVNQYSISTILNPYFTIGSFITIIDDYLSNIPLTQLKIRTLTHTFRSGQSQETSIEGNSE